MICLLIRHAKTYGNEIGAYIGCRTDETLSDLGIKEAAQCKIYKKLLEGKKYTLYSGPMIRACQTAQIIFDREFDIVDEFTEIDFGDFEGKNYHQLNGNEQYQQWIDSNGTIAFPNGESLSQYVDRCRYGFERVINRAQDDELVVIVCHGGNIMALMSSLTKEDYYSFQVKNLDGYWIEFRKENGTISDLSFNCISGRSDS